MAVSRAEQILTSMIDGTPYDQYPQSRLEDLLLQLKEVIEEGGGGGTPTAANVSYDNTTSGLEADDVQDAIDEVFQSVSDGKELIADAITDKGVSTSASDSFSVMATNIEAIPTGPPPITEKTYNFDSLADLGDFTVAANQYGKYDAYDSILTFYSTSNDADRAMISKTYVDQKPKEIEFKFSTNASNFMFPSIAFTIAKKDGTTKQYIYYYRNYNNTNYSSAQYMPNGLAGGGFINTTKVSDLITVSTYYVGKVVLEDGYFKLYLNDSLIFSDEVGENNGFSSVNYKMLSGWYCASWKGYLDYIKEKY